jgi:SAM-dependent methyltransferase
MKNLELRTVLDMLRVSGIDLMPFERQFVKRPFYSEEIYNITFGEQDATTERLEEILEEQGKTEGCRILEMFGGAAYESKVVQHVHPKNQYFSADIGNYFDKYPDITYLHADIYQGDKLEEEPFDVAFVGSTNHSMCAIERYKDLVGTMDFWQRNVKPGGIAVASFFTDIFPEATSQQFIVEYVPKKNVYGKEWVKNKWVHWYMVTHKRPEMSAHTYYPVVVVTEERSMDSPWLGAYWCDENLFRSWDVATVIELMADRGFEYVPDLLNLDTGNLVFKKL